MTNTFHLSVPTRSERYKHSVTVTNNMEILNKYLFLFSNFFIFASSSDSEVCYPKLGCFNNSYPWNYNLRVALPPKSPEKVCQYVISYNQKMKNVSFQVYPDIDNKIIEEFDPKLTTYFVTHGYTGSGYDQWLHELAIDLLKIKPANIFIVNWELGAAREYKQAIGNSRVVAKIISNLIKNLVKQKNANLSDVYLIGHSLGAHLTCYIGKEFKGEIGFLYAFDAGGPSFENLPEEVRCTNKDAKYVAATHTDIGRDQFGYSQPYGTVDYYFNDGVNQPSCNSSDFVTRRSCAHQIAHTYFGDMVAKENGCFQGCPFVFKGVSEVKAINDCADRWVKFLLGVRYAAGVYQIETSKEPPYCNI